MECEQNIRHMKPLKDSLTVLNDASVEKLSLNF